MNGDFHWDFLAKRSSTETKALKEIFSNIGLTKMIHKATRSKGLVEPSC